MEKYKWYSGLLVVEGWKIVQWVIAGPGMEGSVAVNAAVAKGLLWCAIKGNAVSAVHKWASSHITFAHKGTAERKKREI